MSWIVCREKKNEITWIFKGKSFSRILQRLELVEFWILGNCKDLNLVIFSEKLPNLNFCLYFEGLLISTPLPNSFLWYKNSQSAKSSVSSLDKFVFGSYFPLTCSWHWANHLHLWTSTSSSPQTEKLFYLSHRIVMRVKWRRVPYKCSVGIKNNFISIFSNYNHD